MIAYIEAKLKEIEGGLFQKICNLYVSAEYGRISAPGAQLGANNTTSGTPDAYIVDDIGQYTFIEYTTQASGVYEKIIGDIDKCIKFTNENNLSLTSILYFHTSHPLPANKDAALKQKCISNSCALKIYDISTLAAKLYNDYPYILKDELSIDVDTGQILPIAEFIKKHDSKKSSTPLDVTIFGREEELKEISDKIGNSEVVLVFGPAGIGKTKLVIDVCKMFEVENPSYTVLCIKNNDLNLYEDYKRFFAPKRDYLVFVDDANQITSFKHLLDYIGKDEYKKFKVIATVRDYAKDKVIKKIIENEYIKLELIEINRLSKEDIRKIASDNFGITNGLYLDRIVQIAQGNARLASMASKVAKQTNSLGSINDATQLIERYYEDVIEESDINEDDQVIVACVYLLDGIYFEDNETMERLFDITGLTLSRFKSRVLHLHRKEILDLCEEVAVKQSEQILSCYLAYQALYKNKTILISDVLKKFFKTKNTSIVSGLNGISNYFRYDEVFEYLKEQVAIAWNEAKDDNELNIKYLRVFHSFNSEDTLSLIKRKIEDEEVTPYEGNYNFEKNSSNGYDIELELLYSYSESKHYKEAIELVLLYSEKKQDHYNDVVSVFREGNCFGISEHSHRNEYKQQQFIFDRVKAKANDWKNEYYTNLFLELSKYYLKIGFEYIQSSGKREFIFGEIPLVVYDGTLAWRKEIWTSLFAIYGIQEYRAKLIENLSQYNLRFNYNQGTVEKDFANIDYQYILAFGKIIDCKNFIEVQTYYSLCVFRPIRPAIA